MKMYVMNIGKSGKKTEIPKLNEQAAIDLGADLLGEGVLFSIAVLVLVYEYNRQKTNEKNKEAGEKQYLLELENKLNDLAFANEELDTKVRELTRLFYAQQSLPNIESKAVNKGKNSSREVLLLAIEDAKVKIKQT